MVTLRGEQTLPRSLTAEEKAAAGMNFSETFVETKSRVCVACGQKLCKFVANRESF